MSYTEEELSLLSAEERAAISDDEPNVDALKATAVEDDQEDIGAGSGDAAAIVAEAEPDPKTETIEAEDRPDFMTQYRVTPVDGYDDKMAAFKGQKVDLRKQLNDGELSLDEYDAKKDEIGAQEQELREQKLKADIASEQNAQNAEDRWKWDQERFFGEEKNAIYKDDIIMSAYDKAVRNLGNDEANGNRSGQWFLNEADRIVREKFNIGAPVVNKDTPPRKPDLSVVPKTLANLPAAEIAETGQVGEFDHLDKLVGVDLEIAVSRLSDGERDRYRRSA